MINNYKRDTYEEKDIVEEINEEIVKMLEQLSEYNYSGITHTLDVKDDMNDPENKKISVYKLFEFNVKLSEIVAKLSQNYIAKGKLKTVPIGQITNYLPYLITFHPELERLYCELEQLDNLYGAFEHPFFELPEINILYSAIKETTDFCTYSLPKEKISQENKRKLLCETTNMLYLIWHNKNEETYQLDFNQIFNSVKANFEVQQNDTRYSQFMDFVSDIMCLAEQEINSKDNGFQKRRNRK